MGDLSWKSPAALVAVASLLLSVFTFIAGRYDQNRISALEESKINLEKEKLSLESRLKQHQSELSDSRRLDLTQELDKIKRDVGEWEDGVFQSEMRLTSARNELRNYEEDGPKEMVAAAQKNVAIFEQELAQKKELLAAAKTRRAELESQLN